MFLNKLAAAAAASCRKRQRVLPAGQILKKLSSLPPTRPFLGNIVGKQGPALIAEVKRASPSRGPLRENFDPRELARVYQEGGAAAISVLTEEEYFLGSPGHLQEIRRETDLPLLRKDFLTDEYQLLEARLWGSDAVLLIAALLDRYQLTHLLQVGGSLGLECLVEVHCREELELALAAPVSLLGINNRDLTTFATDLQTTRDLAPLVPPGLPFVSESGIGSAQDVQAVARWGARGVLVGEALVMAPHVGAKVAELAGVGGHVPLD